MSEVYFNNDFRSMYFFSKSENTTSNHEITLSFKGEYLYEIIENFEQFLRGCGFVFDGRLDIVPDESTTESKDNFDFTNIPKNNWPFGDVPATQASEK